MIAAFIVFIISALLVCLDLTWLACWLCATYFAAIAILASSNLQGER